MCRLLVRPTTDESMKAFMSRFLVKVFREIMELGCFQPEKLKN